MKHNNPNLSVLYVDDEPKALKYFEKAYSKQYQILTAESPEEGLKILEQESERIGIIVSDQRMPKTTGVEFLSTVRKHYPEKVRILTTAYSDLDSAIQSVNQGHIYQYVVKPWDIQDFSLVLKRAADFFRILSERNELFSLKMNTLQRIILSDRVKTLLILDHSLQKELRGSLAKALRALLKAFPVPNFGHPETSTFNPVNLRLNDLMRGERILHQNLIQELTRFVHEPQSEKATIEGIGELAETPTSRALAAAWSHLLTTLPGEAKGDANIDGSSSPLRLRLHFSAAEETDPRSFLIHSKPSAFSSALFVMVVLCSANELDMEITSATENEVSDSHSLNTSQGIEEIELESSLAELYDYWDTLALNR